MLNFQNKFRLIAELKIICVNQKYRKIYYNPNYMQQNRVSFSIPYLTAAIQQN